MTTTKISTRSFVDKLGVSAFIVVGTGHTKDGRRTSPDKLDTADDKVTNRFRSGLTRLADGSGHWIEKPKPGLTAGRRIAESNRTYLIVGRDIEEVFAHAQFITDAYDQQSVFVTIGSMGYEVFGSTNVS